MLVGTKNLYALLCVIALSEILDITILYHMVDTNFITICLQIIAIFINLIIAFIAVFGERIKGLFYRPELNLSITSLFPDCNLTTFSSGQRAFFLSNCSCKQWKRRCK